jgi:hypothetical protein
VDDELTVTHPNGIKVLVSFPSLVKENKILAELIGLVKGDNNLSKNVANIYTYEIVKYIDSISFGEELDFDNLSVKERVEIVDNLPIAINKQIINFIQGLKELESKMVEYPVEDGKSRVEIDVNFFDS